MPKSPNRKRSAGKGESPALPGRGETLAGGFPFAMLYIIIEQPRNTFAICYVVFFPSNYFTTTGPIAHSFSACPTSGRHIPHSICALASRSNCR